MNVRRRHPGARSLVFDTDYRVWFSEDNPQLRTFEAIQDTYTRYDNVLFVLAPDSGEVFTRRSLEAVRWLTEEAWQTPYSVCVDSLSNFQHTRADGDELIVSGLVPEVSGLSREDIESIRRTALSEPGLRNRLVSDTSHVAGVNVVSARPVSGRTWKRPRSSASRATWRSGSGPVIRRSTSTSRAS